MMSDKSVFFLTHFLLWNISDIKHGLKEGFSAPKKACDSSIVLGNNTCPHKCIMSIHQDFSASKDDSNCPSSFTWVIHKGYDARAMLRAQTSDNALQDKDLLLRVFLLPQFLSQKEAEP